MPLAQVHAAGEQQEDGAKAQAGGGHPCQHFFGQPPPPPRAQLLPHEEAAAAGISYGRGENQEGNEALWKRKERLWKGTEM